MGSSRKCSPRTGTSRQTVCTWQIKFVVIYTLFWFKPSLCNFFCLFQCLVEGQPRNKYWIPNKSGLLVYCHTTTAVQFWLTKCLENRRGSPVDDWPTTDKLHYYVRQKLIFLYIYINVTHDTWHLTPDMWQVCGGEQSLCKIHHFASHQFWSANYEPIMQSLI